MEPPLPDAQVAGGLMRPEAEDVAAPAALRAALALGLAEEMDAEIDDLKLTELLHDVEMPLALVLSEMERRGITLDAGALGELVAGDGGGDRGVAVGDLCGRGA